MKGLVALIGMMLLLVSCHHEDDIIYDRDLPTDNRHEFHNPLPPSLPDTLRILIIGNSFSHDAVDYYFHDLCDELGVTVMTGVLHISSCTLAMHLDNAQTDAGVYNFKVVDYKGKLTSVNNYKMSAAMQYADWDYVTVQQSSDYSGIYHTYQAALPSLLRHIKLNAPRKAKVCLHQTWAYAKDCNREAFEMYNFDQEYMYGLITVATWRAMNEYDFYMIIPSGTAVQNARHSSLGDDLTRDGFHLDYGIGRYIAACAWFQTFTGRSPIGLTIKPAGVSEKDKETAQRAANLAATTPFYVTWQNVIR